MIRVLFLLLLSLCQHAWGHVGSPDVFYDGKVGAYPTRITIRMPGVVPGRAEISVRVESGQPVEVSFLPLYAWTAASNAPPPDVGRLVSGETNLYAGELWLMSFGAYSVEVRIKGEAGSGAAQIPVTSMAIRQLPLPGLLGKILLLMTAMLVTGGIGIAAAAGREAALPIGASPGRSEKRKGILAAAAAGTVAVFALVGGKHWWNVEEGDFRKHLREGAWPDLTTEVRVAGGERILSIEVGKDFFQHNNRSALIPDHGKLMHLFLVREGSRDAFAHLHPIRKQGYKFEVALPPIPEGRYALFCDLTFEGGTSSTATNSVVLPPLISSSATSEPAVQRDPDDSWASSLSPAVASVATGSTVYRFPEGGQVVWQIQKPLRARQDASLRFSVTDAAGNALALEPYMGMLCHAAVLRGDGTIFAHLHPAGNFSMAAQSYFESKLASESAAASGGASSSGAVDHSKMHHGHTAEAVSTVYLPYEFPVSGGYRIWVQFKAGDKVMTGVFDAQVGS